MHIGFECQLETSYRTFTFTCFIFAETAQLICRLCNPFPAAGVPIFTVVAYISPNVASRVSSLNALHGDPAKAMMQDTDTRHHGLIREQYKDRTHLVPSIGHCIQQQQHPSLYSIPLFL